LASLKETVDASNEKAVGRMMDSEPYWTGIVSARSVIGGKRKILLHAGPPVEWEKASGPLRGAMVGALLYEGWAEDQKRAESLLEEGEVAFVCTHSKNVVGPMAGVVSPNMPLFEVTDRKFGTKTYSNLNEGIGKVLRYGAFGPEVLTRLRWMADKLAPVLAATVRRMKADGGGVPFKPLIAQALTMGDDCHNRYNAATSLLLRQLAPSMVTAGFAASQVSEVLAFMGTNNFTALNLGMASAKSMALAAHGVKHSTIVSVMARNGTEVGIWLSGLGDRWFTAPAPVPKGIWFPGYSDRDANPDIGDSAITETAGFGGFAMAAAPAIVSWVGGTVEAAVDVTNKMYGITHTSNKNFLIPFLDFRGTPTGIDLRKVIRTGVTPILNTGIAHIKAGVGQIGAGTVSVPMSVFESALRAYSKEYGN
jgi:hypothetical protein